MMTRQSVTLLMVVVVLSLPRLTHCFQQAFSVDRTSVTHRDITLKAILRKTAEVCRDIAAADGRDFSLTIDDSLTVTKVQSACSSTPSSTSPNSTDAFQTAINSIHRNNGRVGFNFELDVNYHFNNEAFQEGREIITAGLSTVKASVEQRNFDAAQQALGGICHTLQDFYSHSNWVELGKTTPYSTLIRADQPLENLAGPDTPTCKSCTGEMCDDNILPEVLSQGLLTSGYFDFVSPVKPAGKCSHGGRADKTSKEDPVGGINKDAVESGHGALHEKAADLAVDATLELLEDIRLAVGDKNFLRLMGLSQASALCIVIDTTGSMRDDIDEAKRESFNIIDKRRGTSQEPSEYILVPFNDPDFGPLIRTTDADTFKVNINNLTAIGGGDNPELSMSGLELALTAAPSSSEIFVFTDAPAKDSDKKGTVTALIERSKSKVTFLLTDVLSRRRRRVRDSQGLASRTLSGGETELYRDLAQTSGGQAIEVPKSGLSLATAVIEDLTASAVVTVFQAVINPGRPENFPFTVDSSISNMIIYITGASSLTFTLTSSTGLSQMSTLSSGPLANLTTVGNLRRIKLNTANQTGSWNISINSNVAYTVKVTGQSSVNFIYDLVEVQEGAQSGVRPKEGRPIAGANVSLLVTVTGSDTVTITEVTLFNSSGLTEISGLVQSLGNNDFLVGFPAVPAGEFAVRLTGRDTSSTSRSTLSNFQRQASTQIQTSSLSVTAQADITIEPGSTTSIPFTVSSDTTGTFTVRVNNDRRYSSTSPSSVTIGASSGGKANGTVTLTAPASTVSGTDVTLTIEAENAAATEINYAVLRFAVVARVTDLSGPVCQDTNVSGDCTSSPSLCAISSWDFSTVFTDGVNGTGIASITLRQGNGTLNTSTVTGAGGENITVVTYSASCCSPNVDLAAVDRVGNVGTCGGRARVLTTASPMTTTTPLITTTPVSTTTPIPTTTPVSTTTPIPTTTPVSTTTPVTTTPPVTTVTNMTTAPPVNATSTGGHTLTISRCVWISVVVSVIWK
ncbi:von Willebrand factor A domain-containing protein 7-like [Stegastes partitus]|uniref:von Willebrand factor A domain-containing protein 7-like n=1 Tax=Stegastes partitus TaxID=144197 RepID=A0A3B5A8Y5_9TELE|nr:PREDICTED: von Willebrand factor A domain-containing protein 7-like [Stegastes partitus]